MNAPLHVIFGTGPVGLAVMRELVAKGKRVRMVNRSGKADAPAGIEIFTGDASDVRVAVELAKDATTVQVYLIRSSPSCSLPCNTVLWPGSRRLEPGWS